jgi:glycosyltransferase involved in cell wall biosynthesis
VSPIFHLLTGEFPPQRGGVGDYTDLLSRALASRGCTVHVWCPSAAPTGDHDSTGGVNVHRLPDSFGRLSRRELARAIRSAPGCVLLQYVPNALGMRGANLPFCFWLRSLSRRNVDVRVMFHEPYFYFAWQHPLRNGLAAIQRLMARVLLQASRIAYLSTDTWVRYLSPMAPAGTPLVAVPIPSTVPGAADPQSVSRWRARFRNGTSSTAIAGQDVPPIVGHFGTFGDHLSAELRDVIPSVLDADPMTRMVCIGRGSERFTALLRERHPDFGGRIYGTGPLPPGEVAAALRACDVVVQPYPDGVTTRRTSMMAGLANQVAMVTTEGALTETVWRASGGVALAPAADERAISGAVTALLRDPAARSRLAEAGRRTYDTYFALERTIETLLHPHGDRPIAGDKGSRF